MKQRFALLMAALAFGTAAVYAAGSAPAQAPDEAAQAVAAMDSNTTREANTTEANATAEETQPMPGGDATTQQP